MKRIAVVLNIILLLAFCGCNNDYGNLDDIISNNEIISDSIAEQAETSPKENSALSNSSDSLNSKAASSSSTVSQKNSVSSKAENNESETNSPAGILPLLKYSTNDSNTVFSDIAELSDGNFAVAGRIDNDDGMRSFIRIYNNKLTVINEKSFDFGNGFEKICVCRDGGFIAASYCPPTITKLNKSLEIEWVKPYENVEFDGLVYDTEEISDGLFAVLFLSSASPDFNRYLKLSYLDNNGDIIDTVSLTRFSGRTLVF